MNDHKSCSKDAKTKADEFLKDIMNKPENQALQEEMNKIKTEIDRMPCVLRTRKSQTGGGFELTPEQAVTAAAWAGRIFAVLQLGGYLYNLADAYSFQCQAPHWVMGFFGLGDAAYCASKAAILQETIVQLSILVASWAAGEQAKKMVTSSGGKRKSRRRETRKSKKTRKGKKDKKGRKSRRKHDN